MKRQRPSARTPVIALCIGSLAFAGIAIVSFIEAPQPAPLSETHASVGVLVGIEGCGHCHGESTTSWRLDRATMEASCLACHNRIATQLANATGWHAKLVADGRACRDCHGEHNGHDYRPLNADSWRRAGVAVAVGATLPEHFDHRFVAFELSGRHDALACRDCHTASDERYAGGLSFSGLSQTCVQCHFDPHGDPAGEADHAGGRDCRGCHDQRSFSQSAFDHDSVFALGNAHERVHCGRCHATTTTGTTQFDVVASACRQCHDDPHTAFGAQECEDCHTVDDGHWRDATRRFDADRHRLTAFTLSGLHRSLSCASCHANRVGIQADPRSNDGCESCHDAPTGHFAGACRNCHGVTAPWSSAVEAYTGQAHGKTGFPLHNAHDALRCETCHREPVPAPASRAQLAIADRGVFAEDCGQCHASPHRFPSDDCRSCHTTIHRTWSRAAEALSHERTGCTLTGPHRELECAACHAESRPYRERFAHPSRVMAKCESCHADPHGGQFASACATCHDAARFVPACFGFAQHTRFPLRGAHTAVACRSCHVDDGRGHRQFVSTPSRCQDCHTSPHPRSFTAIVTRSGCEACHDAEKPTFAVTPFDHDRLADRNAPSCASCHADPHLGQFRDAVGNVDCARCHSVAAAWKADRFDHASMSAFALDVRHASVPCATCHLEQRTTTGRSYIHFRPIPSTCQDCHAPGPR